MPKVVAEDWSYFNRAVRERAERKPKPPELLQIKLVAPEPQRPPGPAPSVSLSTPPLVGPQPVSVPHTTNTVPAPLRPPPGPTFAKVWTELRGLVLGLLITLAVIFVLFAIANALDASNKRMLTQAPDVGNVPLMLRDKTAGTPTGTGPVATGTGGEAVVADFIKFNYIKFEDWSVVTGWRFARSSDAVPTYQYCYISIDMPTGKLRHEIAEQHGPAGRSWMTRPAALIPGLTEERWSQAGNNCQWYN